MTDLVLPDVTKAINAARRVVCLHFHHSAEDIRANKFQTDSPVQGNTTVVMLQQRIVVQSVLADERHQTKHPEVTHHESITVGAGETTDSSDPTFGQGYQDNVY